MNVKREPKYVIGIDPGINGGICVMNVDLSHFEAVPMPMLGGDIDTAGVMALIGRASTVWLEKVHAMPGQGVTSMFTFGRNYGKLAGIIECLGCPLQYVPPQTWQKAICLPAKAGKGAVSAWVKRTWPGQELLATERSKVPHDGMADAVGIAYYGALQGAGK